MASICQRMMVEVPRLEGWLTVPEVAQVLGIRRGKVRYWIDHGRYPQSRKVGNVIVIPANYPQPILIDRTMVQHLPELGEYITAPNLAVAIGLSRYAVNLHINSGSFSHVRRLGRAVFLIPLDEAIRFAASRGCAVQVLDEIKKSTV